MGYFKTAVSAVSWSVTQRWLIRGLTFVRIAILARLLLPAQFGVFSIAALVLGLLEVFTETWINVFLIQEKGDIDSYINTAWVISILRGFFIGGTMALFSPLISKFFHSPDALTILLAMSVVPIVRGFINPSIAKLQKHLLFREEFKLRTFLFFVDSATAISLALAIRHPFSLVAGMLAGALFEALISLRLFTPLPTISFDWAQAKRIFSRGKWVTAAGIFNYLYQNGDNLVVGRLLGTASLGLYDYAYKISSLPISEVSDVIAKVNFPLYTKISDDLSRLKKAFFKTSLLVSVVTSALALFLFFFARPVVLLVLGPNWVPAIPALKILAFNGLVKAIVNTLYPLFLATQKQHYVTWITLASVLGMGLSIGPLVYYWGLVGAGIAAIIGAVCALPLSLYFFYSVFRPLPPPHDHQ